MFGTPTDPAKAYSSVSLETSIQNASPHKLIVLLFEGVREAIIVARAGIEKEDIQQKGMAITKAIDIILNGLRASINLEEGGAIAQNLYALYDYMSARLLHASMHNDTGALDEVLGLLSEIQEAWAGIGEGADSAPKA
ncbi:MAG: flagellar export chaperone FliS [Candidatus Accumulibacter sp.]|jgi:flagellar protein FliS|nr:flagellar export chaperone FliS [Accumulibacter sp.]